MNSNADEPPSPQSSSTKRRRKHVSRACDRCRTRRKRCDGVQPMCGQCATRGYTCTFEEEDGRKTNRELDSLRHRLTLVEDMLADFTNTKRVRAAEPDLSENSDSDEIENSVTTAGGIGSTPAPQTTNNEHVVLVERLKRSSNGPLLHFGPMSIFSSDNRTPDQHSTAQVRQLPDLAEVSGWSRNLPQIPDLDKALHDVALEYFNAYYASWCLVVDSDAFMCNLEISSAMDGHGVLVTGQSSQSAYSPLLHCAMLFLGLCLVRSGQDEGRPGFWDEFQLQCTRLLLAAGQAPTLTSVRAVNLWSSCLNYENETAYMCFGMAFAATLALGLNVSPEEYVKRGQMTNDERNSRIATFWTIFMQDVLRAISVGRTPMLPECPGMPLPHIDPVVDAEPWRMPRQLRELNADSSPASRLDGTLSLRSSVFHWTAKLGVILRGVIDALYSIKSDATRRSSPPSMLVRRLENWIKHVPVSDPFTRPLPHVLVLHALYNLVCIYLYRPFYRTALSTNSSSVDYCSQAADQILLLLDAYEETHGIQNAPMTLVQIIFGAATIFLLKAVGNEAAVAGQRSVMDKFNACLTHLERHALTWRQAITAVDAMRRLRAEWLPGMPDGSYGSSNTGMGAVDVQANEADAAENIKAFCEWLSTQEFQDPLFWNNAFVDPAPL